VMNGEDAYFTTAKGQALLIGRNAFLLVTRGLERRGSSTRWKSLDFLL
jgi:hypothetical protein